MTAITHNARLVYTAHPALLVDFCGNCGARLWGEERCRECGHEREKPQRGNARASVKELRGDDEVIDPIERQEVMIPKKTTYRTGACE